MKVKISLFKGFRLQRGTVHLVHYSLNPTNYLLKINNNNSQRKIYK